LTWVIIGVIHITVTLRGAIPTADTGAGTAGIVRDFLLAGDTDTAGIHHIIGIHGVGVIHTMDTAGATHIIMTTIIMAGTITIITIIIRTTVTETITAITTMADKIWRGEVRRAASQAFRPVQA
jgi:hypothetical protein